ncbi:MAG TPA: MarR family transcriptional regulator [Rhizomicrobium sp.]|jgi:DNA-binding MarR family transcriptional regulator|nr:MarR family transcriptional regulator [Rhizomicrobium sp.]
MSAPFKPSDALTLWRDVLVARVGGATPDLTERQMAIVLTVYMKPPPHTVRGLASQLKISKPAVTRALDALGRLDYIKRKRDDEDRRNVLVQRTDVGSRFVGDFGESIARIAGEKRG